MARNEYMKEYMKDLRKDKKIQKLKKKLDQNKFIHSWFDPHHNFYLYPKSISFINSWNEIFENQFLLQYEMDNPSCSASEKRTAFQNFAAEKDLIDRIEKYRIFYHSVYLRKKRSPTNLECIENNIFKPDLSNRPDLLPLLTKEESIIIPVCITDDWVVKDEYMMDNDISDSDSESWPEGWAVEYYDFYGTGPGFYSSR